MERLTPCALGIVALVVAAAGTGGAAVPPSPALRVEIKEFAFAPPALTVPAGTEITWINEDEEPHTVTAASGAFASPGLDREEAFTRRFTEPGTYRYFCALHPRMTGTVVVR